MIKMDLPTVSAAKGGARINEPTTQLATKRLRRCRELFPFFS